MARSILAALAALTAVACSGGGASSGSGPAGSTGGSPATTSSTSGSTGSASSGGSSSGGASGSSAGSSAGSTTGTPFDAASFNQAFNAAYCEHVIYCDQWAPYIASICSLDELVLVDYADLPLAVDAGRMSFDPTQAAACIGELEDAGCQGDEVTACGAAVTARVQAGGACYGAADCTNDDCTNNSAAQCTAGTCAATVGLGAACDCTGCGACDESIGLECSNSICAPAGAPGAACSDSSPECAPGLDCVGGTCTVLPVPRGDPCIPDDADCALGDYCLEPAGATVGTCTKQDALGSLCGQDADHAPNAHDRTESQCAGINSACTGAGTELDGGLVAGVCSRLSDKGGNCTAPGPAVDPNRPFVDGCFTYLNCTGGVCVRPPSSGACSTGAFDFPCNPIAAFCDDAGSCQAFEALGGNCTQDAQCGIGAQCNGNGICQTNSQPCSPQL